MSSPDEKDPDGITWISPEKRLNSAYVPPPESAGSFGGGGGLGVLLWLAATIAVLGAIGLVAFAIIKWAFRTVFS